jgi:hypothetical protein
MFMLASTNGFMVPNMRMRPIMQRAHKLNVANMIANDNNFIENKTNINAPLEYYEKFESFMDELDLQYKLHETDELYDVEELEDDNEDAFPSFYKFLEDRKNKLDDDMKKYFDRADKIAADIELSQQSINIVTNNEDLQMLNNDDAIRWSSEWVYDMIHIDMHFSKFMYIDMYNMRDYAIENATSNYYYVGYYPPDVDTRKHGPYYIIALELKADRSELYASSITQNPNYMMDDDDTDVSYITEFKTVIKNMAEEAMVFLKIENLKGGSNARYYFSWLYEDN